jgi:tRNA-dihydrouridine synthase 1
MVAPMVDQSELPFRILCKRYGATLGYTPMINAGVVAGQGHIDVPDQFSTSPEDRPVFAQFCANDPDKLLAAAKMVEHQVDAVDLNLGCPQHIAKRGHYGAFLMEEWELIERLIKTLDTHLSVPVTCKIRVFPDVEKTVAYAKMVEAAGASIVAVHGRTRDQKGVLMGAADWDKIKAVKQALRVPVVANGNMETWADVQRCLEYTGCDAVMSAEGLLWNPALFSGPQLLPMLDLAKEYVQLVKQYPVPMRMVKSHMFRMLGCLVHKEENHDLRAKMGSSNIGLEGYESVVDELIQRCAVKGETPLVEDYRDRREEAKKMAEQRQNVAEMKTKGEVLSGNAEQEQQVQLQESSVQEPDSKRRKMVE